VSDFTITNGVATITNPHLFSTWQDRPDYIEALVASPDAEIRAKKHMFMEFEVALAHMTAGGSAKEDLDDILERYVGEPYIHHNPDIADGRDGLRELALGGLGDSPPPPVCLTVEGDLISVLVQAPTPDPTNPGALYDLFIVSLFRVRDGKVVEHWSSMPKMVIEPEMQH
jgi:predicted SnoaL-like aldol condensation-catalyzing enzyme